MSEFLTLNPEVPVASIESWQRSYADIPLIPELTVNPDTYGGYVSQGYYRELYTSNADTMATDGLTRCSGLIVRDHKTGRVLIGHLEPEFDGWVDSSHPSWAGNCLRDQQRNNPKDVIFIYGSISSIQSQLENECSTGEYGPVNLRKINVNSGSNYAWGFVFYNSTGQVKTFTRDNPSELTTSSAFPPAYS